MGAATMPAEGSQIHPERIRVFVVDAFDAGPMITDQLEREGYSVTACPGHRAHSLMSELEEKGTDLVLVHVRSSPHGALDMLRAAVTVCRLRSRSNRQPVGILTATAESATRRVVAGRP